jgi:hypothetical protein
MSEHDTHWSAKAKWLRGERGLEAAWSTEGVLVHLRLDPAPAPEGDESSTQPELTPREQERQRRAERQRVMSRSSGGPVPRLSEGD